MGKVIFYIMTLFFTNSCFKEESPIEIAADGKAIILPTTAKIVEADAVDWMVGMPRRADKISKGIRLKVTFPHLDSKKLQKVMADHDITGWVVSIYRETSRGIVPLGMVHAPIIHTIESRSQFRQVDFVIVDVFYTAAYISRAYENLACPVEGHSKRVTNIKVTDRTVFTKSLSVRATEEEPIPGKIPEASLVPYNLNGGKELMGSYFAEIALFNHEKGLRKSNFYTVPTTVNVLGEQETTVTGCQGREDVGIPKSTGESKEERIKKFKLRK